MDISILTLRFLEHLTYIRGLSKETLRRYRALLRFYCKTTNVTKLEEMTENNLRDFLMNGRIHRNWKPHTFIIFYRTFSVFLKWCIANGYAAINPLEKIELPKVEKRFPAKFTRQETLRLLEVVYNYPYEYQFLRYRNHAIFSMFVFAGLRRSELLNLKNADVDIDNLTIFVRQGKGNKDRIIPMSFTLAQSLTRYIGERKRLNKTCPEFFASLNRNSGFTLTGLRNLVVKLRVASKLKFSVHKLRHTFATLMLEGGCDIYSISRMMGHSDIKTTTIYLAASAEHLRAQILKHPLNT